MGRKILNGRYKLGRTLGVGAFGKVKEGISLKNKRRVAIKVMNKDVIKKHNLISTVRTEVKALKLLPQHKHVVRLLEVLESTETLYLVLEFVGGGELFDKIKHEGKLDEDTARKYFQQLVSGLEFMHKHKICHRDLKLENLLIDSNGMLKITDFGLSGLYSREGELFRTMLGSPNYVAPEVLNGKGYDGFKADIWSSGVILYALLAGFLPFDEPNTTLLFQKICTADFQYPSTFGSGAMDLLNSIFQIDPEKRASLDIIKKHPWFLGPQNQPYKVEEALSVSPGDIDGMEDTGSTTPRYEDSDEHMADQLSHEDDSDNDQDHDNDNDQDHDHDTMMSPAQNSITHTAKQIQYNSIKSRYSNSSAKHSHEDEKINLDHERTNSHDEIGGRSEGPFPKRGSLRVQISEVEDSVGSDIVKDLSPFSEDSPSRTPSLSPRASTQPIPMTAFDLIGIVSTQMLNNMFTRSLEEQTPVKTYTQFATNAQPAKILLAMEQAIDRMEGCTSRVECDRYELFVVKKKAGSTVTINIKIFHSPTGEYIVECRRQSGNVFRYHDFFDEFQNTYKKVLEQMTTESPLKGPVASRSLQNRKTSSPLLKPYTTYSSNFNRKPKNYRKKKINERMGKDSSNKLKTRTEHARSTSDGELSHLMLDDTIKLIRLPATIHELGTDNNRLTLKNNKDNFLRNKGSESDNENPRTHGYNISSASVSSIASNTSATSSGSEQGNNRNHAPNSTSQNRSRASTQESLDGSVIESADNETEHTPSKEHNTHNVALDASTANTNTHLAVPDV